MSYGYKIKVTVDLTPVKNDGESHIYLALVDTRKIAMIHEFKKWIQISFNLDFPIELFNNDAILHDLNDIRILTVLGIVQVRPFGNTKETKSGYDLISKLTGSNEKYGGLSSRQMAVDTDSDHVMNFDEAVCGPESLQVDENVKLEEVSKLGADEEMEIPCNTSFEISGQTSKDIEKPEDNFVSNLCDRQENKIFKLKNQNQMAENLKLGTLFQQQYYGWQAKSDKSEKPINFECKAQNCPLCIGAYSADGVAAAEKNESVCNDLKPKDVKASEKSICKGTTMSPVKLKRKVDHKFNDKKPIVPEGKSVKNAPISGACGSDQILGVKQKPLTSVTTIGEVDSGSKPMSLDDILKMLRAAVVSRSKNLPPNNNNNNNNPAVQVEVKKKKKILNKKCKASKTKAAQMGKSLNFQKNNIKDEMPSKNLGILDNIGKSETLPPSCNTGVTNASFQFNVSKKKKQSKVIQKTENGNKSQESSLFKGCVKLNKNYAQKTESTIKIKSKTGSSVTVLQPNETKTKTRSRRKRKTQGTTMLEDCEKFASNHAQKTESTIKIKSKTGSSVTVLQPNETKTKTRSRRKRKTQGTTMLEDCEKFASNHAQKTESSMKVKLNTGEPMAKPQTNLTEKENSEANSKTETGTKTQDNVLLKGCEKFDNIPIQKAESTSEVKLNIGSSMTVIQSKVYRKRGQKGNSEANNKTENENKTHDNALLKGIEKLDKNPIQKTESTGEVELKTGRSQSLLQPGLKKKEKKSKANKKIQDNKLLKLCEKLDSSCTDKIESSGKTKVETDKSNDVNQYDNVKNKRNVVGSDLNESSTSVSAFIRESFDPLFCDVKQRKSINDNKENAEKDKSYLDELFSSNIIFKPWTECVDKPCMTEGKEFAEVGSPFKEVSNLMNLESVYSNKHQGFELADRVCDKKEDGSEGNKVNFSPAIGTEDVLVPVCAEEKHGETLVDDINSFNSEDNEWNVSSSRFCVTDQVIALPYKSIDNAIVEETKDVNVDNREEGEAVLLKECNSFESTDFMPGHVNEVNTALSPNEFTGDDTEALFREVGNEKTGEGVVGSMNIGQGDFGMPGSCGIVRKEVIALPYRSIQSMKTEESKNVLVKDLSKIQESTHETENFPGSDAESFGLNKPLEPKKDSRISLRNIINYVKNVFVEYEIFSNLLKVYLIALVFIIMYLDFQKLR